jgi:hypothetical protein
VVIQKEQMANIGVSPLTQLVLVRTSIFKSAHSKKNYNNWLVSLLLFPKKEALSFILLYFEIKFLEV